LSSLCEGSLSDCPVFGVAILELIEDSRHQTNFNFKTGYKMSNQVTTAFAQQYSANVDLIFQQEGSRLRSYVTEDPMGAEYKYFDRVGAVNAKLKGSRHGDVQYSDTPQSRRRVSFEDFYSADMIDKEDKLRMIIDPTSEYVTTAVYALGRQMDEIILDAALGTAYTGKTGSTSVSFPASQQIAVNFVESGGATDSNLTIGKLRQAILKLREAEAIKDGETPVCIINAAAENSLLRTTEVTSADFNTVKALVNGEINTFMGLEFCRTELVRKDASGNSRVVVMPKSAIKMAVASDISAKVDPIPHKFHNFQILAEMSAGAVRMYEEKVVEIKCDPTK